jgi:hypothetical protein
MLKRLWPLLLLVFSGRIMAYEFPIEVIEYIDDVKIIAVIPHKEIVPDSDWRPFKSAPPVSIQEALEAVQAYINSNENFSETTFTSIELKQIPDTSNWHYVVKVKYRDGKSIQPHFFVVLMDAKVISAIKMPEAIK